MALDTFTLDPLAMPEQGSLWEMIQRMAPGAPATPQVMPPAPTAQPAAAPSESWITKLVTPRQSPWAEALRNIVLNMPFGAAVGNAAVRHGIPSMSLGQILQPMVQQGENQRLWGAFQQAGIVPEGTDISALQQAGVDPKMALPFFKEQEHMVSLGSMPGLVDQMFPQATPEQKLAMARVRMPPKGIGDYMLKLAEGRTMAQALKQEAQEIGLDPSTIPDSISHEAASAIRQRFTDVHKQRSEEARAGIQEKRDTERFAQQERMQNLREEFQARMHAQTEMAVANRQAISQEAIANRQLQAQAATDERSRRTAIEGSYRDEASKYQSLIAEATANRDRQIKALRDPVTAGLSQPGEIEQKIQQAHNEYQASIGPYEDARDLARMQMRQVASPVPEKRASLTADELQAALTAAAQNPAKQRKLLKDVQQGLEQNAITGISPDEFIALRRQVK